MAIFRGGKRIGPFDIRMGFPRDKSMHNIDGDPRLKQRANTDNTIGRFRATMAKAEGYARPARYLVRFFPPSPITNFKRASEGGPPGIQSKMTQNSPTVGEMAQLWSQMGEQVQLHCNSVVMPGHDLQGEDLKIFGPGRKIVSGHEYAGSITCSFYADKYLRERHFFEKWMNMAVNPDKHTAGYYKDYVGTMHIYQLGSLDGQGDRDVPTYGIEAIEVYPETIGSVNYAYGSASQIQNISVEFQYRRWHNIADKVLNMPFGPATQKQHAVQGRGGFFDKLPPELQRVGRNVINQAKTQLPTGKIFGGKVFPPFTL